MAWYLWISAIFAIFYLLYKYSIKNKDFFIKKGMKYRKPGFMFSDLFIFLIKNKSVLEAIGDVYNIEPDEKVIGTFELTNPVYFVRDPEMIRKITIKDFEHFTDRQNFNATDDLFSKSLSILSGQKWKDMRATLSPAFTGSKMRQMFELIDECADRLAQYFVKKRDEKLLLEMEDTFSRCTNDIIATCAFGIEVNSNEDRNNEFYSMGRSFMKPNQVLMMIKFLIIKMLPPVAKLFKIQFFDEKVDRFFRSLITETMKVREEKNIIRPDMIHLLMQVRKGGIKDDSEETVDQFSTGLESGPVAGAKVKTDWDDDYLIAQCLLFFIAGFSTTSIALTLLAYELALSPDVQKKLIEEVDEVNKKTNGKLTYEDLQSMKYLEMSVNELLRKWPPAGLTDRMCIKDYKMYENDEFKFSIEKGHQVQIPIYHIQNDSKLYPDPEKFDPERFSEQNIGKILPGSYIPFGAGPRSCIASRFALMQAKVIMYHLLKHFTFEVCEKTQIPLKFTGFFLTPKEGIFLELKKRI